MAVSFIPPTGVLTPVARDTWCPRVMPGNFYVEDRSYYLYAKKRTVTLRDATVLVFTLANVPIPGTTSVLLGGNSHEYYNVAGDKIYVKLERPEDFIGGQPPVAKHWWEEPNELFGPDTTIAVTFRWYQWRSTDLFVEPLANSFVETLSTQYFTIKDAETVYYQLTDQVSSSYYEPILGTLQVSGFGPDRPQGDAPVVLTDDTILKDDERDFALEYEVDPLTAIIGFNVGRNYLLNPSFEANTSGDMQTQWYWDITGTVVPSGYHGENAVYFPPSGGEATQTIGIDGTTSSPYVGSAMFKGGGDGAITIHFRDTNNVVINSVSAGIHGDADVWTPLQINIGEDNDATDSTMYPFPTGTESIMFHLWGSGITVDGAIFEAGYDVSDFDPLSHLITIEYETEGARPYIGDEFQDYIFSDWNTEPYGLEYTDVNNTHSRECLGYLILDEFTPSGDLYLGEGGWVSGEVPSHSGIADLAYAGYNLQIGRRHLPYARISGYNKLRNRATFHRPNPKRQHDITTPEISTSPTPADIQIGSTSDVYVDGSDRLCLSVVGNSGYEKDLEFFVEDQRGMSAYAYLVSITSTSGTISPASSYTDESGAVSCTYSPPTGTGHIDTITASVDSPTGVLTETILVYGYQKPGIDYTDFY